MRATVICDASFDHQAMVGGWAAWVRIDGYVNPISGHGSFRDPPRNSTEAEVMAALNGIWIASNRGATAVLVRSDCMTVQDLIRGREVVDYLSDTWKQTLLSPWGRRVTELTSRHVKGHQNPKRHAAGWVNNWCDEKAKTAMRRARKGKQTLRIEDGHS